MDVKQFVILKMEDDWVRYRDTDNYDQLWQKRCDNCLSPCCMVPMGGIPYDYEEDIENFDGKQDFFTNKFVIMNNDDFEVMFDHELYVCPMNVAGRCMIYEDRPSVCRDWKCEMALSKYVGRSDK